MIDIIDWNDLGKMSNLLSSFILHNTVMNYKLYFYHLKQHVQNDSPDISAMTTGSC